MNYLEEYKKLKEKMEDKKRNYNRYLSDITFSIFEEFIMDSLPLSISNTLRVGNLEKESYVKIKFEILDKYNDFKGENTGNRLGKLKANGKEYGWVNVTEFFQYLQFIPGHSSSEINLIGYCHSYKIEDIIYYYNGILQENEYYDFSLGKKL